VLFTCKQTIDVKFGALEGKRHALLQRDSFDRNSLFEIRRSVCDR